MEEEEILEEIEELDIVDGEDLDEDFDDEAPWELSDMGGHNSDDDKFDLMIGALEDIVVDRAFQTMQASFFNTNCHHFEDADENKLIYMDIFQNYTQTIEGYLEQRLKESVEGFVMEELLRLLDERQEEVPAEIFEMLLSFGDFGTFKELMLSYKKQLGSSMAASEDNLSLCGKASVIYVEEQEDGEERPDLNLDIKSL
eukprot:GILJ01003776.1.p1 GENE.GILJ01003776.1~~GILJ01003776.1.p1  ORF type:complete len:217 (-),score=53.71 GILJ01003776.1:139-735(-)